MQNYDKESHRTQDSEDSAVGTLYYRKNYFSTPTICLKFHRALGNCPDPFISDEVCCYSSFWSSGKNIGQENHLLSRSIYKVMNIHTRGPGMNCDQGYHFP